MTEAAQTSPLTPSIATGADRADLVWSIYKGGGTAIETVVRRFRAGGVAPQNVYQAPAVAFVVSVAGDDLVVGKRPAGTQNSPTSIDTYVVSRGQDRLLVAGAWSVDVAADGRAVLLRGTVAQVRRQLTGPTEIELTPDSDGAVTISGRRLAWCAEAGHATVFDLETRSALRFPAKGCAPRIELEGSFLTWLETEAGNATLIRLRLD